MMANNTSRPKQTFGHREISNNFRLDRRNHRKSDNIIHSTMKELQTSLKDYADDNQKYYKKDNSKRPEIQIYRPGMGLWNKNNQKSDFYRNSQDEEPKCFTNKNDQNSVHLNVSQNSCKSEDLEEMELPNLEKLQIAPDDDIARKLKVRRPDREVYIPKPRVAALQDNNKQNEIKTLIITSKKSEKNKSDSICTKQNDLSPVSKRYSNSVYRKNKIPSNDNNNRMLSGNSSKSNHKDFVKSRHHNSSETSGDRTKTNLNHIDCNSSDGNVLNSTNLRNTSNNVNCHEKVSGTIINRDDFVFEDTDESSEVQSNSNERRTKYTKSKRWGKPSKRDYHSNPNIMKNNITQDDSSTELHPIENVGFSAKTFSQEDHFFNNKEFGSEETNVEIGSNISDTSDIDHSEPSVNSKISKNHLINNSEIKLISNNSQKKSEINNTMKDNSVIISDSQDILEDIEECNILYSSKIRDWSEEVEASEMKIQAVSQNKHNSKLPSNCKEGNYDSSNFRNKSAHNKYCKNDTVIHRTANFESNSKQFRFAKDKKFDKRSGACDKTIPPRFQILNKMTNSNEGKSKEVKSGGILRIPSESLTTEESSQLSQAERNFVCTEQPGVVQKQLFDPNNPDKPVIVVKQQSVMYSAKKSNIDSSYAMGQYSIISTQSQFDTTTVPALLHPVQTGYTYPVVPPFPPSVSSSILSGCFSDQLLQENQTRRIKPLVKKNLHDIQILERELASHLSQGIENADVKAVGQCRWKLQLRYENIILADPRYCAEQNVEQSLWKSVFYQVIEALRRQLDEKLNEETRKALINAVDEGTVFYENLLEKQQETHGFNLANYLDNVIRPRIPDSVRLVLISVQKIFIYLGDLARYREQANGTANYGKARSWYLQAQQLAPKNGRPYNQLAILAVYTRRKLDAVYYYMRSLEASNPFLSARESLLSLFEDARKKYEQVEKKRYQEKLCLKEEREKLRNEMEERQEVWIHPDGSSSKRTSKTEIQPEQDDLSQLTSFDLNKRFVISYLNVHGKLFTKVGMETFKDTANNMLMEFHNLLQRTPFAMSPLRLLQLLVINMFSVANTSLKEPTLEPQCRSALQEHALQLSLAMVALFLERTVTLFKEHLASDDYPKNLISEDLIPLLPAVKIWTDWMSCQRHLWYPLPSQSDFTIGCKGDIWTAFASLLTVLRTVDISDVEILSEAKEGYELVTLPEDVTLAGFVPLLGAPEDVFYVKKSCDQERTRNCFRISRIQFFGDYLCGIPSPYLEFNVEKKVFISLVSNLSAENTESGQDISFELSDDDITEDIFDEDDSQGKSSRIKESEESDIQKLWSRKEALKKTKAQQDRYRAKVQAVLQEHRHKRPTVLEVRPKYLIPDTNCFIDHLEGLKSLVSSIHFVLVVPIVVINELDGLARGTRESIYTSVEHVKKVAQLSRDAIQFLEEKFSIRDSRVQAITSKGSILDTITFRSEDVSDSKGTNDDLILSCCLHYCKDDDYESREADSSFVLQREAVLLTEDRNLRVKALAHNVPVRDLPEFLKWASIR